MVNNFFSIEPVNSETIKNLKFLNLKTPYKIKINETIKNRKCSSLFISDCQKCNPVLIFENCIFDELTILNKNSQIKSIIFKKCVINNIRVSGHLEILEFHNSTVTSVIVHKSIYNLTLKDSKISEFSFYALDSLYYSMILTTVNSIIRYVYAGKLNVQLHSANSFFDQVVFENSTIDIRSKDIVINNSKFINSRLCNIKDINFGNLKVFPLSTMLMHYWYDFSPELTALGMAYDAQNHPNPELFIKWSQGGVCPYSGTTISRVINFNEKRQFFNPDLLYIPINPYKLLDLIFAEKNIKAKWV